jgi:hypothetical protein
MKRIKLPLLVTLFSIFLLSPTSANATAFLNIDASFDLGNMTISSSNTYNAGLSDRDQNIDYFGYSGGTPIDYQFADTSYSADYQAIRQKCLSKVRGL